MTRTQSVTGGKAGQPEHCRPEHIVHSNGSFLRATKKRVQTLTHAHESRARQHQPANTARLSVAGMPRGQRRGVAVAFWLHPLPRAALVRSQLCAGRRQTRHACEASGAATPTRARGVKRRPTEHRDVQTTSWPLTAELRTADDVAELEVDEAAIEDADEDDAEDDKDDVEDTPHTQLEDDEEEDEEGKGDDGEGGNTFVFSGLNAHALWKVSISVRS